MKYQGKLWRVRVRDSTVDDLPLAKDCIAAFVPTIMYFDCNHSWRQTTPLGQTLQKHHLKWMHYTSTAASIRFNCTPNFWAQRSSLLVAILTHRQVRNLSFILNNPCFKELAFKDFSMSFIFIAVYDHKNIVMLEFSQFTVVCKCHCVYI